MEELLKELVEKNRKFAADGNVANYKMCIRDRQRHYGKYNKPLFFPPIISKFQIL